VDASYRIIWRFPDGHEIASPAYRPLNLAGHADLVDLELPQACGGQAECATCRVRVVSGEVTPPTPEEEELRREHPRCFRQGERLACQTRPRSDLVVALLKLRPRDLRRASGD
jgi:adenylate cyclase